MSQALFATPRSAGTVAAATPSFLPADGGAPRAAAAVAAELARVLTAARADARALAAVAARDPPPGAPDADAACRDLAAAAAAMLARTAPAARLVARMPAAGESAPGVADRVLACVDRKLDALEDRLAVLYGLPRVEVAAPAEGPAAATPRGCAGVGTPALDATCAGAIVAAAAAGTPQPPAAAMGTPLQPPPPVSPPAPSTPNPQDFGIDDTALQGLNVPLLFHKGSARKPLPQDAPYEDVVRRSVDALRIQTPVQVANRFAARHARDETRDAATSLLPPTPPTMRLPPMFAAPPSPPRGLRQGRSPDRRALSFDDEAAEPAAPAPAVPATPEPTASALRMTRSRAKRAATEQAVRERYPAIQNFLQSKFPQETVLRACDLLHAAHEKEGVRRPLIIGKAELPAVFESISADGEEVNMLVYTLSKLELMTLRKNRRTDGVHYEFGGQ